MKKSLIRLNELKEENQFLKKRVAELELEINN